MISYVQCFLLILFKWLIDLLLLLYVTSKLFQYSKTLHTILNNDDVTATSWKILVLFYPPPPNKKTHKNSKQPAHILNNDHRKCVTITFYKMYIYIYSLLWSEICHVLLQERLTLLYGRHAQQVNPNTTMAYIWTYILIVTRSDMT